MNKLLFVGLFLVSFSGFGKCVPPFAGGKIEAKDDESYVEYLLPLLLSNQKDPEKKLNAIFVLGQSFHETGGLQAKNKNLVVQRQNLFGHSCSSPKKIKETIDGVEFDIDAKCIDPRPEGGYYHRFETAAESVAAHADFVSRMDMYKPVMEISQNEPATFEAALRMAEEMGKTDYAVGEDGKSSKTYDTGVVNGIKRARKAMEKLGYFPPESLEFCDDSEQQQALESAASGTI